MAIGDRIRLTLLHVFLNLFNDSVFLGYFGIYWDLLSANTL